MITNKMLVDFCEAAIKKPSLYMWGTYGRVITRSILDAKIKQYPKNYSEARQKFLLSHIDGKTVGCDCAGLIKWALWTEGNINDKIRYDSKTDRNTTGLYNAATIRGPLAVLPEIPGLILYKKGHVGVYLGKGYVAECTLGARGDGIVKTKLTDTDWTHWMKIPEIMYVENTTTSKKKISLLERLGRLFLK